MIKSMTSFGIIAYSSIDQPSHRRLHIVCCNHIDYFYTNIPTINSYVNSYISVIRRKVAAGFALVQYLFELASKLRKPNFFQRSLEGSLRIEEMTI